MSDSDEETTKVSITSNQSEESTGDKFKRFRDSGIALTATQIALSIIFLNMLFGDGKTEELTLLSIFFSGALFFILTIVCAVLTQHFHYEANYYNAISNLHFHAFGEKVTIKGKEKTILKGTSPRYDEISNYFKKMVKFSDWEIKTVRASTTLLLLAILFFSFSSLTSNTINTTTGQVPETNLPTEQPSATSTLTGTPPNTLTQVTK